MLVAYQVCVGWLDFMYIHLTKARKPRLLLVSGCSFNLDRANDDSYWTDMTHSECQIRAVEASPQYTKSLAGNVEDGTRRDEGGAGSGRPY